MAPFLSLKSPARPSIKAWPVIRAPILAVLSVTALIPTIFQRARYLRFARTRAIQFAPASKSMAATHANLLLRAQIRLIAPANAQTSTTLQRAGLRPYATMLQTLHAYALTHSMMRPAISIHRAWTLTKIIASAKTYGTSIPARSSIATIQTILHASAHAMTQQIQRRATTASIKQRAPIAIMMTSASAMIFTIFRPAALLRTAPIQILECVPCAKILPISRLVSSLLSVSTQSIRLAHALTSLTRPAACSTQLAWTQPTTHAYVATPMTSTPATCSQAATTRALNSANARLRLPQ